MELDELKNVPDFSGKVLVIYLTGQGVQDAVVIEYAKLETRAGKLFLVGRIPELEGQEWMSNCETACAWDSIIQYVEFKSLKDYQEHMKTLKPTVMQRLGMAKRYIK
jgi:hypothetical protein